MAKVSGPYDIDAVRKEWIGRSSGVSHGRYPVEYDPIRRYCHMVGDTNPLFLDPAYAAQGPYGEVIAPPTMSASFAGNGVWPRNAQRGPSLMFQVPTLGDRFINMNISAEYLRPVRVGDRLSAETVIADVFQKGIRLDPKAIWIVTESRTVNQRGEVVTIGRNTMLVHRTPVEVAADVNQA